MHLDIFRDLRIPSSQIPKRKVLEPIPAAEVGKLITEAFQRLQKIISIPTQRILPNSQPVRKLE